MNVAQWCPPVTAKVERILALFARNVDHLDIANRGWKFSRIPFFIEQVNAQDCIGYLADRYITHKYVLDIAPADGIGFETEDPVQIWTVHSAVFRENIAHPA